MEHMSMVGFTLRGAPLPLLERLAVPRGERDQVLGALRAAGCSEAVLLSTCSRVEVYVGPHAGDVERVVAVLQDRAGLRATDLWGVAEVRVGDAVVEHLHRVSAGLDSRVPGEVEIQTQVRSAFRAAHAAGMTGSELARLFPAALRCGARVRAETALGREGRSLAHRAVDVGLAALDGVVDPAVIVVGSGRMAASAVLHLRQLGNRPHVAARDEVAASRMAGPSRACPLTGLAAGIARSDLVVCATSAAHHVITADQVRAAAPDRSRPLVVVDLSVPRNVDAAVAELPGVRLVDLRGMGDTAGDPGLEAALEGGAALVGECVRRYTEGSAARRVGPVIAELRRHVEDTCLTVLTRAAARTATTDDLARAARALSGTLLHRPTSLVRAAASAGDTAALTSLCDTFGVQLSAEALERLHGLATAPTGAGPTSATTGEAGHDTQQDGDGVVPSPLHRARAADGSGGAGQPTWTGSRPRRTG